MVVDRAWANRFFPGQEVLGRRFHEGGCTTCPWTTVVGVVGNVKWTGLDATARRHHLFSARRCADLLLRPAHVGRAVVDVGTACVRRSPHLILDWLSLMWLLETTWSMRRCRSRAI